jgi:hypothetical protein
LGSMSPALHTRDTGQKIQTRLARQPVCERCWLKPPYCRCAWR